MVLPVSSSSAPTLAPAPRARRWGLWALVAACAGLLVLLAVGMTHDPQQLPSVRLGQPWPDREVPTMDSPLRLGAAAWRGQARIVNLWASWCATCAEEHPALMSLAATLKAQGRAHQLLGLNYKDARPQAQAWLQARGNPYASTLLDTDGRLAIDLGVYGAPETFVVDAQGRIAYRHVGALTTEVIARELLPRLGGAVPTGGPQP